MKSKPNQRIWYFTAGLNLLAAVFMFSVPSPARYAGLIFLLAALFSIIAARPAKS